MNNNVSPLLSCSGDASWDFPATAEERLAAELVLWYKKH